MNIFERVYLFFYLKKKEKDLRSQKKLPFPVISVGNLTVGGTGKTPFTIALARQLQKRQYKPVILTRGYRGALKGPLFITEQMNAEDAGDEPLMMAMEALTVVKCADRYAGGLYAIEKLGFTSKDRVIFILDDGFQHWRLYRDINVLLVDGIKGLGNGRLIPSGALRSPLNEIPDADAVFITKKDNERIRETLTEWGAKNIYFAPLKIEGIKDFEGKEVKPTKQKVFAFAGIGNFQSFIDCLKELNLKITGQKKFIDHKKYNEKTLKKIEKLAEPAELIITTKKDFVKIREKTPFLKSKLCYLEISLKINENFLATLLNFLLKLEHEEVKNLP